MKARDRGPEPPPYEARRWCSGDDAWSKWQPCTQEQRDRYWTDSSMQTRVNPKWTKWMESR